MPAFNVTRSIDIQASPDRVFDEVRNFPGWKEWSPWIPAEPDCKLDYDPGGGWHSWDGDIIGSGKMTALSDTPHESITCKLNFYKPFKSKADVRFAFTEPSPGTTRVEWIMDSSFPWFMGWMTKSMTAMIGMDYDRGLAMLKDKVETGSVPASTEFLGTQSIPGASYIGIRTRTPLKDVGAKMSQDFQRLQNALAGKGSGPPTQTFSIYHDWNIKAGTTEYTAAIAFDDTAAFGALPDGMIRGERPATSAYIIEHTGPYRHLGNAWSAGMARARAKVFRSRKKPPPFEIYVNDPGKVEENALVTRVHMPVKAS